MSNNPIIQSKRNEKGKYIGEKTVAYRTIWLRTYVAFMANTGVPLIVAQKLMRHSDPRLTSNIYTHLGIADEMKELAKLPDLIGK